MRLGSTVNGSVQLESAPVISIPATALTEFNRQPAVWIVDPSGLTVAMRNIEVLRFDPASVVVSHGLATGDIVVTAGVQALHPGQKVRLLGPPAAPCSGLQSLEMGTRAPLLRRLLHDRLDHRRRDLVLPSRQERGSRLRHQDDGGASRLARRHPQRYARPGHGAARTHVAGDPAPRLPPQLHPPRRDHDLRQPEGRDDRRGGARHLVPCPQERRRHAPHLARGRGRAGLQ